MRRSTQDPVIVPPSLPRRFRPVRPLGRGGGGEVLLVTDRSHRNRRLALKLSPPLPSAGRPAPPPELERFRREFLALSRLRHPSLPRVRDFGCIPARGELPCRWFLTYDYLEGEDLHSWSRDRAPAQLLVVAEQLLEALHFLHGSGFLHLDVKPSNVVVETSPAGPRARLIDLGEARARDGAVPGSPAGSPPYAAPEVLRGENAGPAADLFSLGVTLFECLYRERPYRGETRAEVRREHRRRLPAPPARLRPRGAERLEELIWTLLAPDPQRRLLGASSRVVAARALLGRLLAGRPVGLEAPLEKLFGAYDAMARGSPHPTLLLVEGEAGSGKTRLLQEWKDMVQLSGGRFLRVSGAREDGGPEGARGLVEALLALVPRGQPAARALRRLGPALGAPSPWDEELAQARGEQARARYLEASWEILSAAARGLPLVLALDGLRPEDQGSLELLAHLARSLEQAQPSPDGSRERAVPIRAILCLTYRREEFRGAPPLTGEPHVRRVRLEPLSAAGVRALLAEICGPGGASRGLARILHASSHGNPFILVESLRALLEEGAIAHTGRKLVVRDPPETWTLPRSVSELFLRRWESLGGEEKRLLACLALAGAPLGPSALEELSPFPAEATRRLVLSLEEQRVLLRKGLGRGATLCLAHPCLAELAAQALSARAAGRVFRALAGIREREGAPAGELALLWTRAGDPDRALHFTQEASRSPADPAAPAHLRDLYRGLLRLLRTGEARRLEVVRPLARTLSLLGDHRAAADLLEEEAAKSLPAGDRAGLLSLLASERVSLRELERARQTITEAEGLLGPAPRGAEERVRLRLCLARLWSESGKPGKALEACRECLEALEGAPGAGAARALLESAVLSRLGSLQAGQGQLQAAIESYQRSYDLLRRQRDSLEKGGLCCNLANLHTARGEHEQAIRHYTRARQIARRIGARDLEALVGANLGLQYLYRWDLDRAEEAIRSATLAAERVGARRYLAFARLCRGTMLARRGELEEAQALLEGELRLARGRRDEYLSMNLGYQLAKVHLDRGDFLRGLKLARSSLRLAARVARARPLMEGSLTLGAACLYLGDHSRCRRYLEEARRAPAERHPHTEAEVLLLLGQARLGGGAPETAQEALSSAVDALRELRIPLRLCEARSRLATALGACGRAGEARRASDQAWSALVRLPPPRRPLVLWAEVLLERSRLLGPLLSPGSPAVLEVLHEMARARDRLREQGARRLLWQASAELAALHELQGNREEARGLRAEARRLLDELVQGLPPPLARRLRETREARALEERTHGEVQGPEPPAEGAAGAEADVEERLHRLETARRALLDENSRLRAEAEKLSSRVAVQRAELARRAASPPTPSTGFHGLVGASPAMQRLYAVIERAAASDLAVLVRGETGSGKDLVMRVIHELSPRRGGPLVCESLAAVPESLLESELFGHARGAFSGAEHARAGRLAAASGGTLCLSDIDELSPAVQTKLLRVLETGEVRPLGSAEALRVDFRLLTSTRRDLRQAAAQGLFSEKLLYRVQGIEVLVPPLRERREDLPLLVEHFLDQEERRTGLRPRIDLEAIQRLMEHPWPGNVRELENEIRRLAILGPGRIRAADLAPPALPAAGDGGGILLPGAVERVPWHEARDALDRAYLEAALAAAGGNARVVARKLGIHERTVYKLRRRLGL